ncbi:hypothetical protein [Rhizorhabdus argentea]|uniref:hypothetical protein n=1 Tax=Rhizorhabdus argentea TaxID=1387174 RepID=UPI0030EC7A7B
MRKAMTVLTVLAVPMLLLAGCEPKVGKDAEGSTRSDTKGDVAISQPDAAQGVSIAIPGLDGRMKIPGLSLSGDDMDIDGIKPYPGTKLNSLNVTARESAGGGVVEMRFTSPAAPDVVAAYYVKAARASGFTGVGVASAGGKATLTATKPGGDAVTIEMAPGGRGTAGRILVKG